MSTLKAKEDKSYNKTKSLNTSDQSEPSSLFGALKTRQPNFDEMTSKLFSEFNNDTEMPDNSNKKKKRLVETTYDSDVIISSDSDDIAVQTEKDASKRKRTSDTGIEKEKEVQTIDDKMDDRAKNVKTLTELFNKTKKNIEMNINNFLLKSDKITFDYANKTIEHRENSKFQASIYSINKFIRYNSLCNENKKNTIKNPQAPQNEKVIKKNTNMDTSSSLQNFPTSDEEAKVQLLKKAASWNTLKSLNKNKVTEKGTLSGDKSNENSSSEIVIEKTHPAPFPSKNQPNLNSNQKNNPPIPVLRVECDNKEATTAVILTWEIPEYDPSKHEKIKGYELYGYRENDVTVISSDAWKLIGSIPPYTAPVKCTLTDFTKNSNYHFSIRIRDASDRLSCFSKPCTIKI